MKTIPTIGRVVWYKDPIISDQMMSASVAYVLTEDRVNLTISYPSGQVFNMQNVVFHHGDVDECPAGRCCWMPYQKAQAEKNAAAEDALTG